MPTTSETAPPRPLLNDRYRHNTSAFDNTCGTVPIRAGDPNEPFDHNVAVGVTWRYNPIAVSNPKPPNKTRHRCAGRPSLLVACTICVSSSLALSPTRSPRSWRAQFVVRIPANVCICPQVHSGRPHTTFRKKPVDWHSAYRVTGASSNHDRFLQ